MKDNDRRSNLDGLRDVLNVSRIAVGRPSYAEIQRIQENELGAQSPEGIRFVRLARATTADILGGKQKQAPTWPWMLTYMSALQLAARKRGIDPAVIGGVNQWLRQYAAGTGLDRLPWAVAASGDRGEASGRMRAFLALLNQPSVPHGKHSGRAITPAWLELYLTLETNAAFIRTAAAEIVPGLLQTEEYARAVLAHSLRESGATPEEIARLARQRRLSHRHHGSPHVWAILQEEVFRNPLLDPEVMRSQADFLIRAADEPRVTIQVVAAGQADTAADGGSVHLFRFAEPYLGDWACLEQQPDQAIFLYEREDVEHYTRQFAGLAVQAASPDESRRILRAIRDRI